MGKVYLINGMNTGRKENQLILYNTLNGNYTHTNAYGVEVLVELQPGTEWGINKTLKAKVVSVVEGKGNMYILPQHAVLSGHGTAAEPLRTLSEGVKSLFLSVWIRREEGLPRLRLWWEAIGYFERWYCAGK